LHQVQVSHHSAAVKVGWAAQCAAVKGAVNQLVRRDRPPEVLLPMAGRHAGRERAAPSLEQGAYAIASMPGNTAIERRDRAPMAFPLTTGARANALASLKLKDVDPGAGRLRGDADAVALALLEAMRRAGLLGGQCRLKGRGRLNGLAARCSFVASME